MTEIHGEVATSFEGVRDSFAAELDQHGDLGAAFCLYAEGHKVVDVWSGVADRTTGRLWEEDTLQLVLSATKGAAVITTLLLVERGLLDVDAPVAEYWPEFGEAGKHDIPVRWILSHHAGLPAVDAPLTLEDLLDGRPVVVALAAQQPLWEPGAGHGYHSLTFGYLLDELVRRVAGRSLASLFAEEVAKPLGLDFWIGLPPPEEPRVSRLESPPPPPAGGADADSSTLSGEEQGLARALQNPNSLTRRALGMSAPIDFNDPIVHAAEIPSANGICTGRALARLYAATIGAVDGVRVVAPETVAAATNTQSEGLDKVMFRWNRYGLGFLLRSPSLALPTEGAFGHSGSGGSLGFADPNLDIGFGYVMNQMQHPRGPDPRFNGLIQAVLASMSG